MPRSLWSSFSPTPQRPYQHHQQVSLLPQRLLLLHYTYFSPARAGTWKPGHQENLRESSPAPPIGRAHFCAVTHRRTHQSTRETVIGGDQRRVRWIKMGASGSCRFRIVQFSHLSSRSFQSEDTRSKNRRNEYEISFHFSRHEFINFSRTISLQGKIARQQNEL